MVVLAAAMAPQVPICWIQGRDVRTSQMPMMRMMHWVYSRLPQKVLTALYLLIWWGISILYADSYRQIMPSSNSDRMQLRFFFHMFISLPFMSLVYIYIIYLLQCGFQWEAWSWMEPHISSHYPTVETLPSKVTMQPWKFASILVAGGTHK